MTATTSEGHCLCGAVRFEWEGDIDWCGHCHCESCRRQTGSAFTTFVGIRNGRWRWSGERPKAHVSSPSVRRYFCATCGSPVAYASARAPDETHFYAALLVDRSDVRPTCHDHRDEAVTWVELADELPDA